MKKCLDLLSALLNDYAEKKENTRFPSINFSHKDLPSEAFESEYAAGSLTIKASSTLGNAYGVALFNPAIQAGYGAEFLGVNSPKFSLRPLWLGSPVEVVLSPCVSIYVPKFFVHENSLSYAEEVCKRAIEGGYNALLFGCKNLKAYGSGEQISLNDQELKKIHSVFALIKKLGIKIILKPSFTFSLAWESCVKCPYDPIFCSYQKKIFQEFFSYISEDIDYIFWESMLLNSNYRYHRNAQDVTEVEAVSKEIALIEECLPKDKHLIFFVPAYTKATALRQSSWVCSVLDEMGEKTLFSFSAVFGDSSDDQRENHPFWKVFRASPDSSATKILPIINFGLAGQGENLWPTSNSDLLHRFLPRCSRHPFCGFISFWNYLPKKASIGDCNFFVAGQSLRGKDPELLAETWFGAFRPDENFSFCWRLLQEARQVVLDVGSLRIAALELGRDLWASDLSRMMAVCLLNKIKVLLLQSQQLKGKKNSFSETSIRDYFDFFATDIARFLQHLMPSLPHTEFQGINLHDNGFWSRSKGQPNSQEKHKNVESFFPLEPQVDTDNKIMSAIYHENRWLLNL